MQQEEYKKLYTTALELFNKWQQVKGIEILRMLNNEPLALSDIDIKLLLGGYLLEQDKFEEAYPVFLRATELDEQSEVASLGLYIAWAKKDRGDKAIEEMKRFLEKHPANLYKSALEDLLFGLNRGEGSDYEEIILSLAAKNHIHHPQ